MLYLFNLKKKAKNNAHVKALIYEAYIIEEISAFILYYFETHMRTKINHISRHDDSDELPLSENLSIFSQFYNGYFINGYVFHAKDYGEGINTYNNGIYIKGSTFNEFEVDYYGKLEEIVQLQYYKI